MQKASPHAQINIDRFVSYFAIHGEFAVDQGISKRYSPHASTIDEDNHSCSSSIPPYLANSGISPLFSQLLLLLKDRETN